MCVCVCVCITHMYIKEKVWSYVHYVLQVHWLNKKDFSLNPWIVTQGVK